MESGNSRANLVVGENAAVVDDGNTDHDRLPPPPEVPECTAAEASLYSATAV
jgi:hypothetical protein